MGAPTTGGAGDAADDRPDDRPGDRLGGRAGDDRLGGGRAWGPPPHRVVVVHGGPAAPGSAAPVARELARRGWSVLEPWQTARTVDGLIDELAGQLDVAATPPVVLIGHSWGGLLALLTALARPDLVAALVLVGSAALDDDAAGSAASSIVATRLDRLTAVDPGGAAELRGLFDGLAAGSITTADAARLDELVLRADHVDPDPAWTAEAVAAEASFDPEVHAAVWAEARARRQGGALAAAAPALRCPVLVLHGDRDPHPLAAVAGPLAGATDVRVEALEACGHLPWIERGARRAFFAALERELTTRLGDRPS